MTAERPATGLGLGREVFVDVVGVRQFERIIDWLGRWVHGTCRGHGVIDVVCRELLQIGKGSHVNGFDRGAMMRHVAGYDDAIGLEGLIFGQVTRQVTGHGVALRILAIWTPKTFGTLKGILHISKFLVAQASESALEIDLAFLLEH